MLYAYRLTVPPNTTPDAPYEKIVALNYGIITRVEIQFPNGCGGWVGVQVWRQLYQLYPTNDNEWLISDGYTVVVPDSYELTSPRYELKLRGYSYADDYNHTVYFRFTLAKPAQTILQQFANLLRGGGAIPEIAAPGEGG